MYDELVKDLRENHDKYFARDMEAADAIEEMKREIERMVVFNASNTLNNDAMRWIPVTERLPEDGLDILAYTENGEDARIVPANYDRGIWFDCCFNRVAENITHWMPLPEPPKEVDDASK